MTLTLYTCADTDGSDPEDGFCRLIWAETPEQAKEIYLDEWIDEYSMAFDEPEIRIDTVSWLGDPFAPSEQSPHVERRRTAERSAGYSCPSDARCDCCDLAEMDGNFPVCSECGLCESCAKEEGDCEACGEQM